MFSAVIYLLELILIAFIMFYITLRITYNAVNLLVHISSVRGLIADYDLLE